MMHVVLPDYITKFNASFYPMSDPSSLQLIVPFTTTADSISLTLTRYQFDELSRALIAYNKRRDTNRSQAAKRRGTLNSKPLKPSLVFSVPITINLPYHPALPVRAISGTVTTNALTVATTGGTDVRTATITAGDGCYNVPGNHHH